MVVRQPVVAKVKATGAGLGLWQPVPIQCVVVLQRRTLDE